MQMKQKYQSLINKQEGAGLKDFHDSKPFVELFK